MSSQPQSYAEKHGVSCKTLAGTRKHTSAAPCHAQRKEARLVHVQESITQGSTTRTRARKHQSYKKAPLVLSLIHCLHVRIENRSELVGDPVVGGPLVALLCEQSIHVYQRLGPRLSVNECASNEWCRFVERIDTKRWCVAQQGGFRFNESTQKVGPCDGNRSIRIMQCTMQCARNDDNNTQAATRKMWGSRWEVWCLVFGVEGSGPSGSSTANTLITSQPPCRLRT